MTVSAQWTKEDRCARCGADYRTDRRGAEWITPHIAGSGKYLCPLDQTEPESRAYWERFGEIAREAHRTKLSWASMVPSDGDFSEYIQLKDERFCEEVAALEERP